MELATMAAPANRKLGLITRRATSPMRSISSEALKMFSSWLGSSWKMARPTNMMAVA